MRQLDRHGGGVMVERAFAGFEALPPPKGGRPWWLVLGFKKGDDIVTTEAADAAYKALAKKHHPDVGGNREDWNELENAYDQAQAALKR